MKQTKNFHKLRFTLLILFSWLIIFLIISTIYYFFYKNTNASYSFVQKWTEYYSVSDWNLTSHAITDIDGDGQKDILSFSGCVFLSSKSKNEIPPEKQCISPEFSLIVFPDKNMVGQKLTPEKPIKYQWLHKSYLVKITNNNWEYVDIIGLQIRKYQLGDNKLFKEISSSYLDYVDTLTYQISHFGIALILLILSIKF